MQSFDPKLKVGKVPDGVVQHCSKLGARVLGFGPELKHSIIEEVPSKKTWAAAKLWWTVGQARQWPSYNICKISNSKSIHHVSSCSEKLMFGELVQISLKHTRRNMIAPLLRPWKTTTGLNVTRIHYHLGLMRSICLVFCPVSTVYHLERSMPGFNHLTSFLQSGITYHSRFSIFPEFCFDNPLQIVNTSCPHHVLPPTEDLP